MFVKGILVVSMLSVGSSIEPEKDERSQYAVSSQRFHRDDVPLSYEHKAVHIYPAAKHHNSNHHLSQDNPKRYTKIQYAPLPESDLKRNNVGTQNILNSAHYEELKETKEKVPSKPLEPNMNAIYMYKSNEPTQLHNEIHRKNIIQPNFNIAPQNQLKLPINYVYENPNNNYYVTNQHTRRQPENTMQKKYITQKPKISLEFIPKQHQKSYDYKTILAENDKLMSALCAKVPRIHLNVARTFNNFANSPYKEQIQSKVHALLPKLQSHPTIQLPLQNQSHMMYFLNNYIPYYRS